MLVADCGPAVTITPAVCPPSVLTLNVSNIANVWYRGAMQDTLNYTLTGQAHYYTYRAWIEFFF